MCKSWYHKSPRSATDPTSERGKILLFAVCVNLNVLSNNSSQFFNAC